MNLFSQSARFKRKADKLLAELDLVKKLKKFGRVRFTGSYAANLMLSGDIDIYVIGEGFERKRMLRIFNRLATQCPVYAYLFYDYKAFPLYRPDFPKAYYIGMKTRRGRTKWKIDIWFLSASQLHKIQYIDLDKRDISQREKLAILTLKEYRNKTNPELSGSVIYEAVFQHGIRTIRRFRRFLKKRTEH